MAFFQQTKTTTTRTAPTQWDLDGARLFYNQLAHRSLVTSRPNIHNWANEFRLMRDNGISKDRIKNTLKYFLRHIREEYMPKAYSAATFRKKFVQIEAAMERGFAPNQKIIDGCAAAAPLEKAWGLYWPEPATREDARYLIAASYTAYGAYLKALKAAAAKPHYKQWERDVLEYLRDRLTPTEEFTEHWVREVHSIVWRMHRAGSTINIRNWRWQLNGRRYRQRAEALVNAAIGDPQRWARIAEIINEQ